MERSSYEHNPVGIMQIARRLTKKPYALAAWGGGFAPGHDERSLAQCAVPFGKHAPDPVADT